MIDTTRRVSETHLEEPELSVGQIAKKSGISLSTAYRIIRGSSRIRTDKHLAAMRLLRKAGHMKGTKGRTLSILIALSDGHIHALTLHRLISEEISARGFTLFQCGVDKVPEFLRGNPVDGMFVFSPLSFPSAKVPCVALNHDSILSGAPCVACDERTGVGMIFRHLVEKGHRRVAFFDDHGMDPRCYSLRRCTGHIPYYYFAAGLEFDKELVYSEGITTPGWHGPQVRRAVRQFVSLPERPTAIVLPGDGYAPCFYDELASAGLKVPDDISVTGFDDEELAAAMSPPLTTVRKPLEKMADVGMRLLLELVDGDDRGVSKIMLRPELVVRDSVADLNERRSL